MANNYSLTKTLVKYVIYIGSLICLLTAFGGYQLLSYKSKKQYESKLGETLEYLEDSLELPLWYLDIDSLKKICNALVENEVIAFIKVFDEDANILLATDTERRPLLIKGDNIILHKNKIVGKVEVGLSSSVYQKNNKELLLISITMSVLVILGLALFTTICLKTLLQKPLVDLIKLIDSITQQDYNSNRNSLVSRYEEFNTILRRFNKMGLQIREREISLIEAKEKLEKEVIDRKKAIKALEESEEEFRDLFENSPVSIWIEDFSEVKQYFDILREEGIVNLETYFREHSEGLERCVQSIKIKDINQTTLELHQAQNKEQLLQNLERTFTPESLVVFKKEMIDIWNGKIQATYDGVVRTLNDEVRYVTMSYKVAPGHYELLDKVLITLVDITEKTLVDKQKHKLEMQLRQSQKMEAIGTLAGGIAHDFNNILSAVLGFTELAKDNCQPGSTISKDLDEVLEAGNRAKGLVRQILAFSRQDDAERMNLQPASIVKETITMLRPSLPATIEVTQDIDVATGLVFVDPTQLNQILMNLCTNAFHAMEKTGGKLDVSLKEVTLTSEDLRHEPDVTDGTFVQLSICDSGAGIDPTVKDKIFDPYFTTKEAAKGTGMGLSIVHGIVKSYGGFISLYSELGEGTVFHVFLPVVEKELLPENETDDQIPIGRERILFVDDEEILTRMGKAMFERLGYFVTVRNSSIEALETFQNMPDQFDLVITDQTMPGMTGSDLSRRMLQVRPNIPIILCTGYSTIISEEKAKSMGIKEFVLKPLTKKDMANLIRKVLDVS